MGKAYSPEQREHVRQLLEAGRDEETIEKATGVSDRTIRRWKLELERTGRIGKPPESRTGRHRVLNKEVEAALFKHVEGQPDMSVDDMLWWLYETYKIVVGTRTIRRVFERKGDKAGVKAGKTIKRSQGNDGANDDEDEDEQDSPPQQRHQYQSPYAPMAVPPTAEQQLVQALGQQHAPQTPYPAIPQVPPLDVDEPDDEETIQLQLQQIELQKREVELKLRMRRLQQGKGTPGGKALSSTPGSATSTLFNPAAAGTPKQPKRDSRSKKKIEESKKRTAERQERMLRELERRSRRRDHLTAEWVGSKDIWPLRAQGMLAQLMHQNACYTYTPQSEATFNQMYRELYTLVDTEKGDWVPQIHDELLRERMKKKMGQLRTKMQKTGEIVGRGDAFGGWARAEDYTGAAAGDDDQAPGDDMMGEDDGQQQAQGGATQHQQHAIEHAPDQSMLHQQQQQQQQMQYEPVPDHGALQHAQGLPYGNGGYQHAQQGQYPMIPQAHHGGMMPYANVGMGGHGQGVM